MTLSDQDSQKASIPHDRRERSASPAKPLPTDRISFPKQMLILRTYAASSSPPGKIVTTDEVASNVGMKSSTVTLTNPFFASLGLITKVNGGFLPSESVNEYFRAFQWNPDTAAHKLASDLRGTWFAQAVLPRASVRSITQDEALEAIATACSAGPEYKNQLRTLLNYLQEAGLIEHDGQQVRIPKVSSEHGHVPQPKPSDVPSPRTTDSASPGTKASVITAFTQSTEGTVNFNVSVRVDMREFAGWKPERITAFFGGIAEVLAAKAGIEKQERNE